MVGLALKERIVLSTTMAPKKAIHYSHVVATNLPDAFNHFSPSPTNNITYGTIKDLQELGLDVTNLAFMPALEPKTKSEIADEKIDEISEKYFGEIIVKERLRAYAREILKLVPANVRDK